MVNFLNIGFISTLFTYIIYDYNFIYILVAKPVVNNLLTIPEGLYVCIEFASIAITSLNRYSFFVTNHLHRKLHFVPSHLAPHSKVMPSSVK
jgi:hypothetical protein